MDRRRFLLGLLASGAAARLGGLLRLGRAWAAELPPSGGLPAGARPWNVLLVTADTLRGGMIGPDGNREIATPHLDALADEGVAFRRAYTCITTTLPAHASLFTSLYPEDHGAWSNTAAISPRITTIFEWVRARGWHTAAHINMPWLNPETGVPQGVEELRRGDHVRKVERTNPWVLDFLRRHAGDTSPWFLWVHYTDNHTPYHAPPPWDTRYFPGGRSGEGQVPMSQVWKELSPDLRDSELFQRWVAGVRSADYLVGTYKGSVSWVDQGVGELLDALRETGQWERSLVVFTADHGESLGEHHLWFVHAGLYETTARVPLLLRVPGGPRGLSLDGVVSLVDLAPTLLGLLGLPPLEAARGRDLRAMLSGGPAPGTALLQHAGRQLEGVVTARYKYIRHLRTTRYYPRHPLDKGREELYDLQADPQELRDLSAERPELLAELRTRVDALKAGRRDYEAVEHRELSPEVQEQLRALGYVED